MCRKIAIAVGAVLLGLVIVSYTSLPSLAHVKWNDGMAWLDRQVPIETQIKQLRLETDKIDNEIKANLGKLAKMEVETQNLEQNVAALDAEQTTRRAAISAMATSLEDQTVKVSNRDLNGKKNQLELAVSTYEVKKEKLKSLKSLLAAKRQTLEAAHEKIGAMKEQRDNLRVTIAKLESRKELLDIKTQQSQIQVSNSKINECNALAKKISDRLNEEDRVAQLYDKYGFSENPAVAEKNSKSVKEVLSAAREALNDDQDDK
jgi:chromosome segregation ATPase